MNDQPTPTETEPPDFEPWHRSRGCWIALVVPILLIAFLLFAELLLPYLHVAWCLLFGWWNFAWRVLPRVVVDVGTLLLAVAAAGGFAMLWHGLAVWWRRERAADQPDRWRPRWTVAVTLLVVVGFAAATAMVGMVHQLGWIASDERPLWRDIGGRGVARRSMSKNNLKQFGIVFHGYHGDHGSFPQGIDLDPSGRPLHSWITRLLPQLERQRLHDAIDFSRPWDAPANEVPLRTEIRVLLNPGVDGPPVDERGYPLAHYAANVRLFDADPARRFADVSDGLTFTILAGEVNDRFVAWGNPLNLRDPALGVNRSPDGFGSPWTGGAQFLMGDGSVQFLSNDMDPALMRALATPDGGEEARIP